jgi:HD superfamily phosphohydrolase
MTGQAILAIPEVAGLDAKGGLVRIPPELDVPLTDRVRAIIDTAEFRRLARISQLGLVSLVYPAALHTRFEHSLGVYRLALRLLKQLAYHRPFTQQVSAEEAELLIAAALVHDIGHWPFCHLIEEMHLPGVPTHERFAESFLLQTELAEVLRHDWHLEPREIVALLSGGAEAPSRRLLASILSGPIDIDKMDYLFRDSLHAGVPYGRNYDQQRLIGSFCLNAAEDGLAITDKGKTAAEMLVFARYVMFSEVYWHHGVRSATAMLQRAFFLVYEKLDLDRLFRLSETELIQQLQAAADSPAAELLEGLFGPKRRLYKRLAQISFLERPALYRRLAHRPYPWLAACAENLAHRLSEYLGQPIPAHEILLDAPPVKRETPLRIDVWYRKEGRYRSLQEASPVAQALAPEQFDDYVKRVRVFGHPRLVPLIGQPGLVEELLAQAAEQMGSASESGYPYKNTP